MIRALAPTNVAWVQILRRSHMWLEFVVASLLCSESFFGELWFSPLFKNQHFQIPIRWDRSSGFNEFNMIAVKSTPEEWRKGGMRFYKKRLWVAAIGIGILRRRFT